MNYSAANAELWYPIIQTGIIAGLIVLANVLRRKVAFIRNSLMPTAVIAGFILLILRTTGVITMSMEFLEAITYHMLALGFIALTLRAPEKQTKEEKLIGSKSGALIVSTYLVQGIFGLIISLLFAYTIKPDFFKAAGILLPMAFGQGPGQANNVGSSYEALGMAGGQSFGLSLAAMGFLVACTVGVIFLNILNKKSKVMRVKNKDSLSGSVTLEIFQDDDEIPIAESIDKLSVQAAIIALLYLLTFLLTAGVVWLLERFAPGLAKTLSPLLWGFNFIVGSIVAMGCRSLFKGLKKAKVMNHQYLNNYLLNRLSGLAFDIMIVAGIASIDIGQLRGNIGPFIAMSVLGAVVTTVYLLFMCKRIYKGYEYEGFFSMFGMLTGTISSGVLLLREVDPDLKTPASNNLITGSSFGIIFGAPMLLLISYAAQSEASAWITLGLLGVYLLALLLFIAKVGKPRK